MMRAHRLFPILALCLAALSPRGASAVPNPAAAYAEKLGYTYRAANARDAEPAVVVAPGIEFNAWDFYRGKVGSDHAYGARYGYDTISRREVRDGYVAEFAVCVPRNGRLTADLSQADETGIPMLDLMELNGEPLFDPNASRMPPAVREAVESTDFITMADKYLPGEWCWTNVSGRRYIGAVRDQGSCGSCYAFGAAACAEGTYNYATTNYDANCADFSESYIAWCLGTYGDYFDHFSGCDGADYEYAELQAMTNEGICTEADFPYQTGDPGSCTHGDDPRVVFDEFHRVAYGDMDAIKTAIMTYGVVDAAVFVGSAFDSYDSGVYDDANNTCTDGWYTDSNHAISLVGWDDTPAEGGGGCWILRNSWGPSWGENGYMRLRYDAAVVHCAVCYLTYGPPAPTPPSLSPIGSKSVVASNTLQFVVSATPTDGDTVTLSVSNPPAGSAFTSTNENGTFTWTNAGPIGVCTMLVYAVDKDGADFEAVVVTVHDGSAASGLFLSEYIEDGGNKAVEIFNGTGDSVDLLAGGYTIRGYQNGAVTPDYTVTLTGTIANLDVYVVAASSSAQAILDEADRIYGLQFNGDDAVTLAKNGTNIDVLGMIGDLSVWGEDVVKVRKSTVVAGTTTYNTNEWDNYTKTDYSHIGAHVFGGGEDLPSVTITNPAAGTQTVSSATSTADVEGTCNAQAAGALAWSNGLTGIDGTITSATSWVISGIALDYGTNVITVAVTNDSGGEASDAVTIVRESPAPPEPPSFSFTPPGTAHSTLVNSQLTILVTATEPDGDTISLGQAGLPAGATFAGATNSSSASGTFTWTPSSVGLFTATFVATDADGTTTQIIDITVSTDEGGGLETFANYSVTGSSYVDGSFVGQDGSTWTYWQCRGDKIISNETPCLGQNRTPAAEIDSGSIAGGCGTLSLDLMQAFSTPYSIDVYVNSNLVTNIAGGAVGVVDHVGPLSVNVSGAFVLTFRQANTAAGQVSVDNIAWTGFSTGGAPDEDGDGISDDWEDTYSGTSTGLTAGADDDGDGADNFDEFVADTNPTNRESRFVCLPTSAGGYCELTVPGSTGRLYNLYIRTNLITGAGWVQLYTNVAGTNTTMTFKHENTDELIYYRLKAALP